MTWRRRIGLAAAAICVVWLFLAVLPPPVSFPHPYFTGHPRWHQEGTQIIAHRGGWGLWPEHTLAGYQRAVDLGVDALELDVQRSADGVMVVFHDPRVDRSTDGTGRVDSFTFAQLQQLDAGFHWSAEGDTTHPFRGQGLRIPALDEVLQRFPAQHMVIELKSDDAATAEQLCGLLQAHNHEERAIVAAFSTEALTFFRQACPGVATSASSAEATSYWILHLLRLDLFARPAFQALQIPQTLGPLTIVDERFVNVSQGRGLPVQVWTIDEEQSMKRLMQLHVQAIITRRPDRLLGLLQSLGQR
ncbi:MAG: glycerophosphodiester phosphodiesterase [bacterium]|nr:glycerophosphodiester phosphodiesterase [bacterium]